MEGTLDCFLLEDCYCEHSSLAQFFIKLYVKVLRIYNTRNY